MKNMEISFYLGLHDKNFVRLSCNLPIRVPTDEKCQETKSDLKISSLKILSE